jgi:flavin-binding protein dodecin
MSESVYKVIELVGTSQANWEISAENAVYTASKSLKELRVAEITSKITCSDKYLNFAPTI